jgi:hypothetical protein
VKDFSATRGVGTLFIGACCIALACSSKEGSEVNGASAGSHSTAGGDEAASGNDTGAGPSTSGNGSGGLVINVGGTDGGGDGSRPGNGTPEVCDGEDNDDNGIIDDVDAGHDGVCDCLNIATIGHIGPWSNGGNLFAKWLNERTPRGAVELGDDVLTPEKLKGLQVIVVLHAATMTIENSGVTTPALHEFSDDETTAFDAWVRGGGGLMTTIGYTQDEAKEVVNVNKLLLPLGLAYSTSKLDLGGDVQNWMPHPITDGISNIHINNGVEPDSADATTIARGTGDKIALQVLEVDSGRIAVWGDEWVTYDSEWADTKGQQVELFWLNLLKWLSPPTECQVPIPPRVQ